VWKETETAGSLEEEEVNDRDAIALRSTSALEKYTEGYVLTLRKTCSEHGSGKPKFKPIELLYENQKGKRLNGTKFAITCSISIVI
jgi:hypothetical protein